MLSLLPLCLLWRSWCVDFIAFINRLLTGHRNQHVSNASAVAGASPDVKANGDVDTEMHDADDREAVPTAEINNLDNPTPASKAASCASSTHSHTIKTNGSRPTEPLSPPVSTASAHRPGTANGVAHGGGDNDAFCPRRESVDSIARIFSSCSRRMPSK